MESLLFGATETYLSTDGCHPPLLLRARDLAETDTLQFTQEYVAEMLGVRRTSVTLVARTLQQAGMIKYSRGKIQLIDLDALRETACECYATVQSFYEALLIRRTDEIILQNL